MCCFSRPVESVTNTRIFARRSRGFRQFLVYQMKFHATEDLAMILPIPVPKRTADDAVRFISLKRYPNFFSAMESGFPSQDFKKPSVGGIGVGGTGSGATRLEVVNVGSFDASFVPTIKDFSRLDAQFRLSDETWDKLPEFKDYGFAVFKLKKDADTVHPMAFDFPRTSGNKLFFPTMHIHDGKAHEKAEFDHTLYAQFDADEHHEVMDWKESMQPAGMFLETARCAGLVQKSFHVYRQTIVGTHENKDLLV